MAQTFQTIGDLLKNAISCVHQWLAAPSEQDWGQGVMCDTLPVHISGYCIGRGVYVDPLAVNCLANYLDIADEGWYHVGHYIIGGLTK